MGLIRTALGFGCLALAGKAIQAMEKCPKEGPGKLPCNFVKGGAAAVLVAVADNLIDSAPARGVKSPGRSKR